MSTSLFLSSTMSASTTGISGSLLLAFFGLHATMNRTDAERATYEINIFQEFEQALLGRLVKDRTIMAHRPNIVDPVVGNANLDIHDSQFGDR